jgi:hypothetical protein
LHHGLDRRDNRCPFSFQKGEQTSQSLPEDFGMRRDLIVRKGFPGREEKTMTFSPGIEKLKILHKGLRGLEACSDRQERFFRLLSPEGKKISFGRAFEPGESNGFGFPPEFCMDPFFQRREMTCE